MNEIITKLNEIEEKAESIISDAKSRKEQLSQQLETDKKKIDIKYDLLEVQAMENLKQKLVIEADIQIADLEQKSSAATEKLDRNFAEQKEKLAEEIFRRITG